MVGAGITGLTAAYEMAALRPGLRLLILEAGATARRRPTSCKAWRCCPPA
ncbi:NAD(P)-binding protein, partial [Actinoplanes sp. NPDC051411]